MTIRDGDRIDGRYRAISLLGRGAMGEVWRAHDVELDRDVAVKVVHGDLAADATFRKRFDSEARNAAQLTHPNIAMVHTRGQMTVDGQTVPYLVMELVEGHTLADRLGEHDRLGATETLDVLGQAAAALAAAHDKGIVHRDVKPGNLLIRADGVVKLADFGISRARDAAAITGKGDVVGTPQYMAPEQLQGGEVTFAADVYALGVVGYECLTGRRPSDYTRGHADAQQSRDPLPQLADVPQEVRSLLARALAEDPADRYPDGQAFAAAARQIGLARETADRGSVGTAEQPTERLAAGAEPAGADRAPTPVQPARARGAAAARAATPVQPARARGVAAGPARTPVQPARAPRPATWTPREEDRALAFLGSQFLVDPSLGPVRAGLVRLAEGLRGLARKWWAWTALIVLGFVVGSQVWVGLGKPDSGWVALLCLFGLPLLAVVVPAAVLLAEHTHWIRIVKPNQGTSPNYLNEFPHVLWWWWSESLYTARRAVHSAEPADGATTAWACRAAQWQLLAQLRTEGRLVERRISRRSDVSSTQRLSPAASKHFWQLAKMAGR